MAWLISEARVLASVDVADTHRARAKGLLGRDGLDGAFAIPHCRWIHTLGMRFDLDVAYVDASGAVIKIEHMRRHRMALPVAKADLVIEARAGAFERWGLKVGDPIEIRLTSPESDSHSAQPPHSDRIPPTPNSSDRLTE